jgi:hypothetical protein
MKSVTLPIIASALLVVAHTSFASYSQPGQGLQPVLSGTVNNGALYFGSQATWTNTTPSPGQFQPYTISTAFTMPVVDNIVNGRLVLTFWGGTANYTNMMDVTVNGTSLLGGTPLTFGTTNDANASFSATQPSVYGSGSGVWLVSIPVAAGLLNTDGTANTVQVLETAPTSDGRISQISLLSVYQQSALNNQFQFSIAEGSGDLYRTPGVGQTDAREISFGGLTLANPTAAALTALYTYGDAGQNDRLYFNDTQLGGDDIATWAPSGTGLGYGPDVVSFDVLSLVGTGTNDVRFSVSSADMPDTREFTLRPQIAVFTVAIPEPSTCLLVIIGSLAIIRRRRQS